MIIGLKRDLREENDNIIYPQEASYPFLLLWIYFLRFFCLLELYFEDTDKISSLTALLKSSIVTAMRNALPLQGSLWLKPLKILQRLQQ